MFVIPPRNPFYQAASDRQLKAGIYGGQHQSSDADIWRVRRDPGGAHSASIGDSCSDPSIGAG